MRCIVYFVSERHFASLELLKTFVVEVSTFECSTDQFVICLVLPECLSARIFFISDSLLELLACSRFSFSLGFGR